MKDFSGKVAIVTGGGSGMGRALVRQLAEAGCSVAMCDISEEDMAQSKTLAEADAQQGVKISTFVADVADEDAVNQFADHVRSFHKVDHVHLLINNAGIGGGGSFVAGSRADFERCFNVCWYGVYNNARAFMPMLIAAEEAHIVNVSSVNGFWASVGPGVPHTAYSAAKFAVKGFTEALRTDLAVNAPHIQASVVMPGHIATKIATNTLREFGAPDAQNAEDVEARAALFTETALTSSEEAATIILDGVRANEWRILVGPDAIALDKEVRADPYKVYEPAFAPTFYQNIREGKASFFNPD